VQGCGKSLAAKFVAREWKLPLLKLDGRLYDKYVGESERNFRRAIDVAESMAPVVLWIDEIEKVFGHGAHSEYDAGLSRRIFGLFLTWLQEKKENVFVVGAANDLLSVPPELLRKGRFDEIFFVDLPVAEEREEIFEIHLRLRNQEPGRVRPRALSPSTDGFSGAEIEQAVIGRSTARSTTANRPRRSCSSKKSPRPSPSRSPGPRTSSASARPPRGDSSTCAEGEGQGASAGPSS
jgi:SpoVK/Ycf46/Vps4 family AAA+-type ATPase